MKKLIITTVGTSALENYKKNILLTISKGILKTKKRALKIR
jgi:hypothetical protein